MYLRSLPGNVSQNTSVKQPDSTADAPCRLRWTSLHRSRLFSDDSVTVDVAPWNDVQRGRCFPGKLRAQETDVQLCDAARLWVLDRLQSEQRHAPVSDKGRKGFVNRKQGRNPGGMIMDDPQIVAMVATNQIEGNHVGDSSLGSVQRILYITLLICVNYNFSLTWILRP